MNSNLRHAGIALATALLMSACGGGGGSPGSTVGTTSGGGATTTSTTSTTSTTPVAAPVVKIVAVDGSGANINSISGGQSATLKATFATAAGVPIKDAVVSFTLSNNTLATFNPTAASALTDNNGVATITVKPSSFDAAGALTVTASAVAGQQAGTGTFNMAIGAAPLTLGTLAFAPAVTGSLPAFSTAVLQIPVTSGGSPVSVAPGIKLDSLCRGDGTASITEGAIANGVMSATYTNKGCVRGTDTITVSVGNTSKTIGLPVDSANIGTIQFTSTDVGANSIVLRGSGGINRKESATVTFKVVDQNNVGLAGVDVAFSATTNTGGLTVAPVKGTTDASGNVSTTVSSGTIPTPVRVQATATRNGKTVTGLSDTLTISTGLPIQKSMSLSASVYNIEGLEWDGVTTTLSILLADQYGNPISDGTTVNFITEGGAVGSALGPGSCTTTLVNNVARGGCDVTLRSQEFKPKNGRVTVLAYVQGLEDFTDTNGDGQYTAGEPFVDLGDAFLDAGDLGVVSGTPAKTWSLDGQFNAGVDTPIPFVDTTFHAAGDGKWGLNYIRRSIEIVFSGSVPTLYVNGVACQPGQVCTGYKMPGDDRSPAVTGSAACGLTNTLTFRMADVNNNPLPAGASFSIVDPNKVTVSAPGAVPSTAEIGGTYHTLSIKRADSDCANPGFSLNVTTPKGKISTFLFK